MEEHDNKVLDSEDVELTSEKEDIPTEFWKKWSDAELNEQIEMVKHMLIAKSLAKYFKMTTKIKDKKEFYENYSAQIINDLFLDLYYYLENNSKLERFK